MLDLEVGERLHDRVDHVVLVVALAQGVHERQTIQAHGDSRVGPRGAQGARCYQHLEGLHVEGAARLPPLDSLPIVVGPFGVEVVVPVETAHAPLRAGIAHAYVHLPVLDGGDAAAVPLRVGVGYLVSEVHPPVECGLHCKCFQNRPVGVARLRRRLGDGVCVRYCSTDTWRYEPEYNYQVVPVAPVGSGAGREQVRLDVGAPLDGNLPCHLDQVVLDANGDHLLRGCCIFLFLEDDNPVFADRLELLDRLFTFSLSGGNEDEVVDVSQVGHNPPCEGVDIHSHWSTL